MIRRFMEGALLRPSDVFTVASQTRVRRLVSWAGLAVALVWLLVMFGPGLATGFQIYDDHEIIDMIGRHPRLPIGDVWSEIERRSWERNGRFRPMFWTIRVAEAAVAGDRPGLWVADRVVLAGVSVAAVYFLAIRVVGPLPAALLALLPFSGPQFETWIRFGSNEVYAFPLALTGTLVLVGQLARGRSLAAAWPGYLLLALAALAKENFLLISVLGIAASAVYARRRGLRRADLIALGAATSVAVLHLLILLVIVKRYGTVYQQPRTLGAFSNWSHYAYSSLEPYTWIVPGAVAFVVLAFWLHSRAAATRLVVRLGTALAMVMLPQLFFYAGAPQIGRYLYPLVIGAVMVWAAVGWLSRSVAVTGRAEASLAAGLVLILVLSVPLARGTSFARKDGRSVAWISQSFEQRLAGIVAKASAADTRVVVLQPVNSLTDVERVLSLARYLTIEDGLTVMTLPAARPPTAADAGLASSLASWSRFGGGLLAPYTPVPQGACVSIMFGRTKPVCATFAGTPG